MNKVILIVNPAAKRGETGKWFQKEEKNLRKKLGDITVAITERPRHAVEISEKSCSDGFEQIVAVGGDGLLNEVVNGMMMAKRKSGTCSKLGCIIHGSGGDFRKSVGFSGELEDYLNALIVGKTKKIDLGTFSYFEGTTLQEKYFINILSLGMEYYVDTYVARSSRLLGSTMDYFNASLNALIRCTPSKLQCILDDGSKTREMEFVTRSFVIANGQYFGSGLHIAPHAQVDDGFFDIVDLGDSTIMKFLWVSSKVYSGKHVLHPSVKSFRCRKMTFLQTNEKLFPFGVDGEPFSNRLVSVEILPKSIDLIVP